MTNEMKLQAMFKMQDSLQCKLNPEWKSQPWDQAQAIITECGELLDALGFKWWKKQQIDLANVRIELVDIWHFVLNDMLVARAEAEFTNTLYTSLKSSLLYAPSSTEEAHTTVKVFLTKYLNRQCDLALFFGLCEWAGLPFDELYKTYMLKNTLNTFRWNNGYREGSYVKIWHGKEDNYVATRLIQTGTPFESLYKALEEVYSSVQMAEAQKTTASPLLDI